MLKTIGLFYNYIFNIFIMSKKNLFLVATWYLLWGLISSKYNKKSPWELEKKLKESKEKWEGEFKVLFEDFIDTHKHLFEEIQKEDFYKKAQKSITEKKWQLLEVVDSYKDGWIELLEELKVKWKDYIVEASDKLEKLYQEKKWEIEWLKETAPVKMTEIKDKLLASFDEIKEKLKEEKK